MNHPMSEDGGPAFHSTHQAPENPEGRVYCFVFRRRELLLTDDFELPDFEMLNQCDMASIRSQYLGTLGETHCYSVELADDAAAPAGTRFRDLRSLFGRLDETVLKLGARAVQIVEWDRTHQFCGACGRPTEPSTADRSRACPRCKLPFYPRLSPAMIVAVEKDDSILLARSPHFPPGIYSVPAGFVEPGESVEEAVAREVLEETNIRVRDVRYYGSQPWPFPNSLMLGFTASYAGGEIRISQAEIEDAGWYRHDEMPNLFPGNISIAQWLIHDFLARHR
jgi:NAD+ diphosphatase